MSSDTNGVDATDVDGGDTAVSGTAQAARLTSTLLSDPAVLAAFTDELGTIVGKSSGYIESLPKSVKRRINALKKLQVEVFALESQFYTEIHELEQKYEQLYAPLFKKRQDIVNALIEPTDSECEWESEDESEEPQKSETADVDGSEKVTDSESADDKSPSEDSKGIPEFWLTIFKNVEELSDLVQETDEPVLKNLLDIRVTYLPKENSGFRLEFIFAANEFFTNDVLTKEYTMRYAPDPDQPLDYEGPEIIHCKGCNIDWKPGKNVTVKLIKKKQKTRGAAKKFETKSVKVNSFFNFFSPPEVSENTVEDEEVQGQLETDYDIGRLLHERIIPRAILYFTGDALDNDSEDDDEDDDDEAGSNEDEGEDPDYVPPEGTGNGPPNCSVALTGSICFDI